MHTLSKSDEKTLEKKLQTLEQRKSLCFLPWCQSAQGELTEVLKMIFHIHHDLKQEKDKRREKRKEKRRRKRRQRRIQKELMRTEQLKREIEEELFGLGPPTTTTDKLIQQAEEEEDSDGKKLDQEVEKMKVSKSFKNKRSRK